jgi:hypothetical protein
MPKAVEAAMKIMRMAEQKSPLGQRHDKKDSILAVQVLLVPPAARVLLE